jgi:hypothetical protein
MVPYVRVDMWVPPSSTLDRPKSERRALYPLASAAVDFSRMLAGFRSACTTPREAKYSIPAATSRRTA